MGEACQSVYGKSLTDVGKDLSQYARSDRFYGALFDVKLEKSVEDPQVSEASALDSGLVLADLLGVIGKHDEARAAFEQLGRENPDKPEIEESLGYLAWQSGDTASARQHFSRAFAAGSKDPQMCFHYAVLQHEPGGSEKDILPALEKAVQLKPDYVEARLQLGLELVNQKNYKDAVTQLRQITKINPEQARYYFSALAYADMQTGDTANARKNAEQAKQWAKTPEEAEQANSIIRYLDEQQAFAARQAAAQQAAAQRASAPATQQTVVPRQAPVESEPEKEPPPKQFARREDQLSHVEGMAQKLDCNGESARLHVLVGQKVMVFEITDPSRVNIKHSGEAQHDFTCGPQKPFHVAIEYAPSANPRAATAGVIHSLEF